VRSDVGEKMTIQKLSIIAAIIAILAAVGCWWFLDWGLGYESMELRRDASFSLVDPYNVEFAPSENLVLDYRVGRRPSRSTTAHGCQDRILIEFTPRGKASGLCDVVHVERIGYRRGGNYSIESPDDAWVKIRKCQEHFRVEAAIKITTSSESGSSWEIVYIPRSKVN